MSCNRIQISNVDFLISADARMYQVILLVVVCCQFQMIDRRVTVLLSMYVYSQVKRDFKYLLYIHIILILGHILLTNRLNTK